MQFKKRKVLIFLFYLPFSLLLAFIGAEIFVRIYFYFNKKDINTYRPSFYFSDRPRVDRLRFKSHPFLPYLSRENDSRIIKIYKPDIKQTVTYDYKNSSLGFRTPERPYKKPLDTRRIITLGGSTTWEGPTNDTTWPALLEKKLNNYYQKKGINVEVINLAVDGGVSYMSLNILDLFGVFFEPDLVISYDGVNDFWFSMNIPLLPDYSNQILPFNDKIISLQYILPRWMFDSYAVSFLSASVDRSLKLQSSLIDQVWKFFPVESDETFANGQPLYYRNFKLMRATCQEYKCKFVASIPHWVTIDALLSNFDENVRKFFQEENINYLDLQNILPHNDYSIHADAFHFTNKGLDLVAEEWFKKIVKENLIYTD